MIIYIYSHYEAHYEIPELIKKFDWVAMRILRLILFLMLTIIPVWFTLYNVLFMVKVLSPIGYLCIEMIMCCIPILGAIALICFRNFKFTGYPYLDKNYKDKCMYIRNVLIFWILGKQINLSLHVFICYVLDYTNMEIERLAIGDTALSLFYHFVQALELLQSEFLVGIFVLDVGFIDQFNYPLYHQLDGMDITSTNTKSLMNKNEVSIDEFFENQEKRYQKLYNKDQDDIGKHVDMEQTIKTDQTKSPKGVTQNKIYDPILKLEDDDAILQFNLKEEAEDDHKIIQSINESDPNFNNKPQKDSQLLYENTTNMFKKQSRLKKNGNLKGQINYHSLTIDKEPIYQRSKGLGKILFGQRKAARIKIRELPIENMNKFLASEISKEVCTWKDMPVDGIEKDRKFCHYNGNLYIISEANSDMIDQITYVKTGSRENLTAMNKFQILLKIVNIMEQLYKPGIDKGHGHFSPTNILISKNGSKQKIIDFGFVFLKKYCGFLFEYCNKSQYTCPELLQEKGQVIFEIGEKNDVYSFGLIMW